MLFSASHFSIQSSWQQWVVVVVYCTISSYNCCLHPLPTFMQHCSHNTGNYYTICPPSVVIFGLLKQPYLLDSWQTVHSLPQQLARNVELLLFFLFSSEPPVTPVHRVTPVISYLDDEEPLPPVPRINLRPLASYYTLTYIVLALAFVWLFSLPSLYCLLGLCCFVFVYCVISYCIHGTVKKH